MSTNQKVRGEHLRESRRTHKEVHFCHSRAGGDPEAGFPIKTFGNDGLRKTVSYLFLAVCLLNVGWSWPFHKKEAPKQETEKQEQSLPAVSAALVDPKTEMKAPSRPVAADVTVLASRLPSFRKKLSDVPFNVTFKDTASLDTIKPNTLQDAVRDAEGVVLYDSTGNGFDKTFALRGFTDPSTIIFLVDGVRVNEVDGNTINFPLIRMRDTESVQIDRGSASSVYGSNAFGGVVHVTTGQPSEKPVSLFGGLEWTSFHGLRFNQGISGTLKDKVTPLGGKLGYYFNGERDSEHGFRANGEFRLTSFDIKTAYELPNEQGKISFGLKHIEDAVSMPGEMTFQQYQDDPRRCNKPLDGRKFKNTIVQLEAEKKFWDDRILASILASERWNDISFVNTTGTFVTYGYNPYTSLLNTKNQERDLTWQTRYQDTWDWLGNESMIGMEYRAGRNWSIQRDAPNGTVPASPVTRTDRTAQADNVALFWGETLKLFDRVIPYVSMRHDYNWFHSDTALNRAAGQTNRWHKSTVSTGVTVKPVKSVDLFTNYSQGFRVPTITELAPYGGTALTPLNPELSNSYEVGSRVRAGKFAEAKASYFLIDVQDEIRYDSTAISAATPYGRNINVGKTRRYGIETRLDLTPVEEVKFYGGYTLTEAWVRQTDGAQSLKDGRTLGQVPENRFVVGMMVSPLLRLGENYKGFKVGLYGTITGRQHPTSYETATQATLNATGGAGHWIKPYSVWDLVLSYDWRGKQIYLKVNNVFDEKYYSRAINATSFGTAIYPAGTYTWVDPGASREFVIGAKWEFL
ncbi:MAG: TonB-dependent receptor [Candidatus Omnitrophota bacterium]